MPDSAARATNIEPAADLTLATWHTLSERRHEFGLDALAIQPLHQFLESAESHRLTPEEKGRILDQATLLLSHLYPHLPYKLETFHFIHPVAWLESNVRPFLDSIRETDFHGHVIAAFALVRDAHTLYGLPSPYRGAVAFLPFQMRYYVNRTGRHYVVTRVMAGFEHEHFRPGAEIAKWAGTAVDFYIQAIAGRLPGGNTDAMFTRGVLHSTLRPLTFCQAPAGSDVPDAVIEYLPPGSKHHRSIRIPWGVATGFDPGHGFPSSAFSLSAAGEHADLWCSMMHSSPPGPPAAAPPSTAVSPVAAELMQPSKVPEAFEIQFTGGSRRDGGVDPVYLAAKEDTGATSRFGYIRIKRFSDGGSVGGTDIIVNEFRRLLQLMDQAAPDGLILDLRSNSGGDVHATEQMLQMLTPGKIDPARFHFANTSAILQILQKVADLSQNRHELSPEDDAKLTDALVAVGPWLDDAQNLPLPHGERLTSGQTLTDPESANQIGQIYLGRVVVLTDALTYSAAEVFAAGFQDHAIGPIIGVDHTTGGGGANVWTHRDLMQKLGPMPGLPFEDLPLDATMSVAIRRLSRVGFSDGGFVEDVGVIADLPYVPDSADDVMTDFPGLIRLACDTLFDLPKFRADLVRFTVQPDGSVKLDLSTTNLDALDVYLEGQRMLEKHAVTRSPDGSATAQSLTVPPIPGNLNPLRLKIVAFTLAPGQSGPELFLAAVRRLPLYAPPPPEVEQEPAAPDPTESQ